MNFVSNFARALVPVAIAATAAASAPAQTSSELRAVEASLGATQSMTADFLQTDGKGRQMAGTLSLKRPGKIRFAYGGGVNMLLVADGSYRTAVLGSVNYGRDCDSIATMSGAIAGALAGESAVPQEWSGEVARASRLDLRAPGLALAAVAREVFSRDVERRRAHEERFAALAGAA